MILRVPLVGESAAQLLHGLDRFGQLPRLFQTHRAIEQFICCAHIPWLHHAAARLRLLPPSFFAVGSGEQRCEYGSSKQHKQQPVAEGDAHVRTISNRERCPRQPLVSELKSDISWQEPVKSAWVHGGAARVCAAKAGQNLKHNTESQ